MDQNADIKNYFQSRKVIICVSNSLSMDTPLKKQHAYDSIKTMVEYSRLYTLAGIGLVFLEDGNDTDIPVVKQLNSVSDLTYEFNLLKFTGSAYNDHKKMRHLIKHLKSQQERNFPPVNIIYITDYSIVNFLGMRKMFIKGCQTHFINFNVLYLGYDSHFAKHCMDHCYEYLRNQYRYDNFKVKVTEKLDLTKGDSATSYVKTYILCSPDM